MLPLRRLLSPALRRGRRRERGSLSLEAVFVFPMALLIVFTALQAALYFHAGTLAAAAAREGARDAAAQYANVNTGQQAAEDYLNDVAGDSLTSTTVQATRGPETATVTVTGSSLSVIPGVTLTVRKSATFTTERITQ